MKKLQKFCNNGFDLQQLFRRIMIGHSFFDTMFQVSFQHFAIGFFQNGLGRHNLIGNINALPVLVNHFQNPVNLAPSGL